MFINICIKLLKCLNNLVFILRLSIVLVKNKESIILVTLAL